YDALLDGFPEVGRYRGSSYTLLNEAYAALVTSGTATLETALFGVPQVVCYKGDKLSYLIARRLITIKYISLVNLIMDREVVKELIQDEMNEAMLSEELKKLAQPDVRNRIQSDYILLRKILGNQGASGRAADAIIQNMPGR
ncbi:MAG TPA: lipid-A-disaccharide synthase, partial [Saprospiraceae bacterium]|nr:lipid-A-disaccharide synthase [Saprospiraceae bacterium]